MHEKKPPADGSDLTGTKCEKCHKDVGAFAMFFGGKLYCFTCGHPEYRRYCEEQTDARKRTP